MGTIADESSPLLRTISGNFHKGNEHLLGQEESLPLEFDSRGDNDNPVEWPPAYKWSIVALLALTHFTVTFTCISLVPVAGRIVADLNHGHTDKTASVLLITVWELGEAAGPLLIAPLSEIFGRYPVINAANVLFIMAVVMAALAQNTQLFIAARFLNGLAVASNVLNPSVVGDMFIPEQRGRALSLITLAPLLGGAVGPAIAGSIAETSGWRNILWMCAALAVCCETLFLIYFKETFKTVILLRRLRHAEKVAGRPLHDPAGDGKDSLWKSIARPAVVLSRSGILQAFSVYGSITFTYFYIMSTTLPEILEEIYALPPAKTGLAFISFSVGSATSVVFMNRYLDRIYIRLRDLNHGIAKPEHRLPLSLVGSILLSCDVSFYGWAAERHMPLPIILLSVAMLGATLMLTFLPLTAYIVDAFGLYSASAMTAVIITRCLTGTFLPLLTAPLTDRLGYGWGFTCFGVASLLLSPIPALIMRYGAKWRQSSPYTQDTTT